MSPIESEGGAEMLQAGGLPGSAHYRIADDLRRAEVHRLAAATRRARARRERGRLHAVGNALLWPFRH